MAAIPQTNKYDDRWFKLTNLTVVTTKRAISMNQWRSYLTRNNLLTENARVLVVSGIHGAKDGRLGRADPGLLRDSLGQLRILAGHLSSEEFAKHMSDDAVIETDRMKMKLLDAGSLAAQDEKGEIKLDNEKLMAEILAFQPSLLVLAFCWTEKSTLNDVLLASGVYSVLIMQKDRENITQSRCIFLDEHQRRIVDEIVDKKPKNVFFTGEFGSGKTVMAMEAARIMLSQRKKSGKAKLIITVFSGDECRNLIGRLRSGYRFRDDGDVEFADGLETLCRRFGVAYDREETAESLREVVRAVARRNSDSHTVLLVDEIHDHSDWSCFVSDSENVSLILVFNHWSAFNASSRLDRFRLPSTNGRFLHFHLEKLYRNSFEVLQLYSFLLSHDVYNENRVDLSRFEDFKDNLPPGKVPTWVQIGKDASVKEVLEHIRDRLVDPGKTVSVVLDSRSFEMDDFHDVECFCKEADYELHSNDVFLQNSHLRGCEDDVIICFVAKHLFDTAAVEEMLTRARFTCVFVTRKTWTHDSEGIRRLQSAACHKDEKCCGKRNCEFLGRDLLETVTVGRWTEGDTINLLKEQIIGNQFKSFADHVIFLASHEPQTVERFLTSHGGMDILASKLGDGDDHFYRGLFEIARHDSTLPVLLSESFVLELLIQMDARSLPDAPNKSRRPLYLLVALTSQWKDLNVSKPNIREDATNKICRVLDAWDPIDDWWDSDQFTEEELLGFLRPDRDDAFHYFAVWSLLYKTRFYRNWGQISLFQNLENVRVFKEVEIAIQRYQGCDTDKRKKRPLAPRIINLGQTLLQQYSDWKTSTEEIKS